MFVKIKSEGKHFNWCLGFSEHKLFFAHDLEGKTKSTKGLIKSLNSFDHIKIKSDPLEVFDIEKYIKTQTETSNGNIFISKRRKFLEKKIKNIKSDIENAKSWGQIKDIIENDSFDLNSKEFSYKGVVVKFRNENEFQRRDLVYQKIKKLKRAEKLLVQRLEETEQELEKLNNGKMQIQTTKEKPLQIHWFDDVKISKANLDQGALSQNKNFKNLRLENVDGLVGLNAEGNDYIRKNSSKDFLWFHLEGYPGAHCILKISNVEQITPEKFAAIGSMLRDFSDLKMMEIQLVYSHLKNISGVKGTKGQVIVKKPRYLKVIYQEWKEIISVN